MLCDAEDETLCIVTIGIVPNFYYRVSGSAPSSVKKQLIGKKLLLGISGLKSDSIPGRRWLQMINLINAMLLEQGDYQLLDLFALSRQLQSKADEASVLLDD